MSHAPQEGIVFHQSVLILIALECGAVCAQAQWLNYRTPDAPRAHDGKVNLTGPVPHSDGKPDLSGLWEADSAPTKELLKYVPGGVNGLGEDDPSQYFFNVFTDLNPQELMRPETAAAYQKAAAGPPPAQSLCAPPSTPMADAYPVPFKIVQTRKLVLLLYESDTFFRQIFMDGRRLPQDPLPDWLGYSTGRWENDELVVETIGLTGRSVLDIVGHPHSDDMRVTERFHRRDFGHLDVQITIDDPKMYIKPFTYTVKEHLMPDTELLESFCSEDEKDTKHLAAAAR